MGRGDAKKTAVNYDIRRGGKIVYKGRTKKPEKQAKEPTQQGKRFSISTTDFEVCRNPTSKTENLGLDSD